MRSYRIQRSGGRAHRTRTHNLLDKINSVTDSDIPAEIREPVKQTLIRFLVSNGFIDTNGRIRVYGVYFLKTKKDLNSVTCKADGMRISRKDIMIY